MKKSTTLIAILLCAVTLLAQAPEKFTYQAVVRNASNVLVVNAQVGVRVNILRGSASGDAVYSESHVTTTNANGLVTVNIGGGSVLHGSFTGIDWSGGPYFLKTDIDPNGGNTYSITSTQQLLSVPYALYATEAANGFSGDYNDLTNLPQIPQIPADVSAFNNDAGYITGYTETDPQYNAWDKDYNDLINTPTIPTVPTNVSAFTNDAGYLTSYTETDPIFTAWSKDYNDLINTPTIPTVPTNVSAFTNDAGYITSYTETDPIFTAWDKDYNDLINTPTIPTVPTYVSVFTNDAGYITSYTETDPLFTAWDKDYNDLINTPTIPTVPTNVSAFTNDAGYITSYTENDPLFTAWNKDYNDLTNKPNLATVATSGNYNDLSNTPTIPTVPTNVSAFTNDVGYITEADVQQAAGIPENVSAFNNDAGYLTSYTETDPLFTAWDKNYNDLTNKPTLFSGNYNDLTNKPNLFSGNYNDLTNKPNFATVATSGNYNDLSNRPTIPTVPTNVSAFTNDVGYITADNVPAQVNADWNATSGVAKILNKPSNVSAFTNDAGYITEDDLPQIPQIPADVSAFNNDAHYITAAELNALLVAMNNTIDSLRDRIEELENGESPVNPDPVNPDTTITPGTPVNIDGLACPGAATVTDWDGNVYNTVAIGQQCWLKENLRSTHYADGQPITLGTSTSTTARYRYNPGGNASNLYTYGFVYNWPAVMYGSQSSNANPSNVRGVCPMGWHVPSNQEWSQLTNYVRGRMENRCDGNAQNIAKALASTTNWISNSISCTVGDYAPNNNTTGFSALPAGDNTGNVGTYANFWSSTQSDNSIAYAVQLGSTSTVVTVNADATKSNGYSVRCVRDSAITSGVAQMVVTGNVGSVTTTSASCSGIVNSNNGLQVTSKGVCWSQMPNPNVDGDHTSSGSGIGSFTVSITGLQPSTTYYVRAYATTNAGTTYGNTQTFTTQNDVSDCGLSTVTDYDGNTYNIVKIGDQCWMKENLRTTHYADGTMILTGSTYSSTEAYYYTPSGTSAYGYLYNWLAVMHRASSSSSNPSNVRGICPIGWHVPSDAEWSQLTQFVGGQSEYCCSSNMTYIAKSLAAKTGWSTSTTTCAVGNELSTNNATGFGALPAGNYYGYGYYTSGNGANFWSATEASSGNAWDRRLGYGYANVSRGSNDKYVGYSVRCLRD